MICAVNSAQARRRFAAALADPRAAGVACQLGALHATFGALPGSGWQFYTSGTGELPFALGVRGTSALLAGPADAEELAGFLGFLGVCQLRTTGAVPEGWQRKERFCCMVLPACAQLNPRSAPEGLQLNEQPGVGRVADFLCRGESLGGGETDAWDCFYSETCTLVNHGRALIWTAETKSDGPVATAGAYALWNRTAYLSGVETKQSARGQGIGSFLVGALANRLAKEGYRVELLCTAERESFYHKLGFTKQGEVGSYGP